MKKFVIIESCHGCPYFSMKYWYHPYDHKCGKLEKMMSMEEAKKIPEYCPLEDHE